RCTFADLPANQAHDSKVFSYLSHSSSAGSACQSASAGANSPNDSRLWTNLRLRPEFGGPLSFVDLHRVEILHSVAQHRPAVRVDHGVLCWKRSPGSTFEQSSEEEEEIYEVINISKIKAHTPNLRCVALNFCIKVTGSSLKKPARKVPRRSRRAAACITALDITSTELSANCLENVLTRIRSLEYLAVGYCDFFTDAVMEKLMETGNLRELRAIDISYTCNLSEPVIGKFIKRYGPQLLGLMLHGKPLLNEFFWTANIPLLKNIKICTLGQRDGWYFELNTKVHIDQVINAFASHCPKMERLEIQTRCPFLQSLTLADGGYYEMANSNFERAQRSRVVRTFNRYATSIVQLLSCYAEASVPQQAAAEASGRERAAADAAGPWAKSAIPHSLDNSPTESALPPPQQPPPPLWPGLAADLAPVPLHNGFGGR
uniref:F-box domain-containing protein n=1 Tax=Macrostomum lignano TaxID=282301 RepID=A0A1I8FD95_9PLAT